MHFSNIKLRYGKSENGRDVNALEVDAGTPGFDVKTSG